MKRTAWADDSAGDVALSGLGMGKHRFPRVLPWAVSFGPCGAGNLRHQLNAIGISASAVSKTLGLPEELRNRRAIQNTERNQPQFSRWACPRRRDPGGHKNGTVTTSPQLALSEVEGAGSRLVACPAPVEGPCCDVTVLLMAVAAPLRLGPL